MATLCRWLLGLYLLALAAPVLQATAAHAAAADAILVELCSAEGVRRIALDPSGQPIQPPLPVQHAGHDCAACATGCGHHGLCMPQSLAFGPAWPTLAPYHFSGPALVAGPPAARAPLPARGPPTLS